MKENDLVSNRQQILEENFDIIIYPEIGMCQQTRLIAFSRLAPIQINTWGHSDTSGLPNIDYFVSSKYFNSKEDHSHYSEKLILFDSLGTYYYDVFKELQPELNMTINYDTFFDPIDCYKNDLNQVKSRRITHNPPCHLPLF